MRRKKLFYKYGLTSSWISSLSGRLMETLIVICKQNLLSYYLTICPAYFLKNTWIIFVIVHSENIYVQGIKDRYKIKPRLHWGETLRSHHLIVFFKGTTVQANNKYLEVLVYIFLMIIVKKPCLLAQWSLLLVVLCRYWRVCWATLCWRYMCQHCWQFSVWLSTQHHQRC